MCMGGFQLARLDSMELLSSVSHSLQEKNCWLDLARREGMLQQASLLGALLQGGGQSECVASDSGYLHTNLQLAKAWQE